MLSQLSNLDGNNNVYKRLLHVSFCTAKEIDGAIRGKSTGIFVERPNKPGKAIIVG